MPCYHPIPAVRESSKRPGLPDKNGMKLHPKGEAPSNWLPCQKCLGCRERQQQELAIRVEHEARNAEHKHFLTLTLDEEHIGDGGLHYREHMQKFWKRVRRDLKTPIKHLTCGEYGDRTRRAHYHAAVIGLQINDLKKWEGENSRSPTLEQKWGNGIVTISELTTDRIRYVAGYVLKKAGYRKQIYCDEYGEEMEAPFRKMSQGLGKEWITKYATDLQHGYLQHNGAKYSIPRYYADKIKANRPDIHQRIQERKAETWKELTEEDRRLLHNGEKIRQKEIRERKPRDGV